MIITGVTKEQFELAVQKANVNYEGNLVAHFGRNYSDTRFAARVVLAHTGYQLYGSKDTSLLAPGQRRSAGAFAPSRRINAVCWHGYRDVLIELFNINPSVRVYTAMAKYRGKGEFYKNYPLTGDRNIGSLAAPVTMPETCDCA